jgi:hypothetical protein
VLHSARLLTEQRRGRERLYRFDPEPLLALDAWLERHRTLLRHALKRLKTHVEDPPTGGGGVI